MVSVYGMEVLNPQALLVSRIGMSREGLSAGAVPYRTCVVVLKVSHAVELRGSSIRIKTSHFGLDATDSSRSNVKLCEYGKPGTIAVEISRYGCHAEAASEYTGISVTISRPRQDMFSGTDGNS